MTKHLRPWLTNAALERLDGVYKGDIARVDEELVRNRFTGVRTSEPVVTFADGVKWIPSMAARQALVGWFGADTDAWAGRRVHVLRMRIERTDKKTGEVKVRYERCVSCPDTHARAVVAAAQPEVVVEREWADYDDSPEALAAASKGKGLR